MSGNFQMFEWAQIGLTAVGTFLLVVLCLVGAVLYRSAGLGMLALWAIGQAATGQILPRLQVPVETRLTLILVQQGFSYLFLLLAAALLVFDFHRYRRLTGPSIRA
jgi:hypothetical protein